MKNNFYDNMIHDLISQVFIQIIDLLIGLRMLSVR